MIANMLPNYRVLNEEFIEYRAGDKVICPSNQAVVVVVYNEMRSFYVKRSFCVDEYLPIKARQLQTNSKELPKSLLATNLQAQGYGQSAKIYYLPHRNNLDYYKVLEMFALSGFFRMVTRVVANKGSSLYIYSADYNIGLKAYLSSTVALDEAQLKARFADMMERRVARERRYNTAAWTKFLNYHPYTPYGEIHKAIYVKTLTTHHRPPYTAETNNIRDVNQRLVRDWANDTTPRTYLQMQQMRDNYNRTGSV